MRAKFAQEKDLEQWRVDGDERTLFLRSVYCVIQSDFRSYFGEEGIKRCGHFIDEQLTSMVDSYGYWVDYPEGNHNLVGDLDGILASVVSDDGRYLFTAGNDRIIIKWDLTINANTHQWIAHRLEILVLAYHSGVLVSAGDDKPRVWNAYDHNLIHELKGHSDRVTTLDLSPKGDRVLTGGDDSQIREWSVHNGECLRIFTIKDSGNVTGVKYLNEDGSHFMSVSEDNIMRLWDSSSSNQSGRCTQTVIDGVSSWHTVSSINFNRSWIICFFIYSLPSLFHLPEMRMERSLEFLSLVGCFHPRIPHILAFTDDNDHSVVIFDLENDKKICNWPAKGENQSMSFTPDGLRLITVDYTSSVSIYHVPHLLDSLSD